MLATECVPVVWGLEEKHWSFDVADRTRTGACEM